MPDSIVGSLISAGSSLLGGYFNNQQANKLTNENIAQQQWSEEGGFLPGLVANAKAAGLSPLAALGVSNPGQPVAVGTGDQIGKGMADAGQDIGRAVTAYMDPNTKADLALKQAQADNLNADTVGKMRRTFAAPGSPPGLPTKPDGTQANPIPSSSYYKGPNGEVFVGPSKEFASSQFGPSAWLTGTEQLVSEGAHQLWDAGKWVSDRAFAPDVWRNIVGTQGNTN